jgi:ATP-binding cassette subfamily F protein uup
MSLLSVREVSFTWGGPNLLDEIDLEIERGERIGLLGRNGCGKSTLLQLLAGEVSPDNGEIKPANGVQISRLLQDIPQGYDGRVAELVAAGYIEPADDWQVEQAVKTVLSRMKLGGELSFATLSSGMKRRVLLAQALVGEPDILLLDEPTNHLDIPSMLWLEGFLKSYNGTVVFVTHDRLFLQELATRIVEIDRGRLFDWTCDYPTFLKRKQAALAAEEQQNIEFDKKLAREEVWIRQGIKARRTRNEGRVRALKSMREDRRQRREKVGNVNLQAAEAEKSGRLVIEVKNVSFGYENVAIVDDFSTIITREDKVGIIGPNGAGKTTLLKLLLGELEPDTGTIRHGTRLDIIYFDQLREQIDEEKSVIENVGEGQEMLTINGREKHIYGYLQDFLFTPERARRPARFLSGGERNRLLLAQLFKRPSNLIVLDEPTNDLDAETLELLEELVTNYNGTVLLVSHDRAFLNNVVTGTFVLDGDGQVKEYAGGYDDYIRQRDASATLEVEQTAKQKETRPGKSRNEKPAGLNFKQRRELESLPEQIAALEAEQSTQHTAMAEPSFFKQDGAEIAKATARLETVEQELAVLYERWEELESRE